MPCPLKGEQTAYEQPQLGLEAAPLVEITLEELHVIRKPTYRELSNGQHEWRCRLSGQADLFHPDRNGIVEASTIDSAEQAKSLGLRKSSKVTILVTSEGVLHQGTTTLFEVPSK